MFSAGTVFGLITILAIIVLIYYEPHDKSRKTESFVNVIPAVQSVNGAPENTLGAAMPAAPYIGGNSQSPKPFIDPALSRASLFQLKNLQEDLKSFLANEAGHLETRSDPAVQLPLQNVKADAQRINDEVSVQSQNPGLMSQITLQDLNTMRANLSYLQRANRRLVSGSVITEGFEETVWDQTYDTGLNYGSSGSLDSSSGYDSLKVKLQDLIDLIAKITAEINRLAASGTTDDVIQARIAVLVKIQSRIQDIVDKVNNGHMLESDIPIDKAEIENMLIYVMDPNSSASQILDDTKGVPEWIKYFLPNASDDTIQKFLDGFSWGLTLDYTSKNKALAGGGAAYTILMDNTVNNGNNGNNCNTSNTGNANNTTDSNDEDVSNTGWPSAGNLNALTTRTVDTGKPGSFDWKGRAQAICNAIKASGYDPNDFACLDGVTDNNFNWRGQAKMVCNRATTVADPGYPESIGCPSPDWPGWSS